MNILFIKKIIINPYFNKMNNNNNNFRRVYEVFIYKINYHKPF